MRNLKVAESWIAGESAYGSHFFTDGRVIYSYGTHFPIAYRFDDGVIFLNSDRYSNTTSKHTNYVKLVINQHTTNFIIIFVNTKDLKEIANTGVSLFSQLKKSEAIK